MKQILLSNLPTNYVWCRTALRGCWLELMIGRMGFICIMVFEVQGLIRLVQRINLIFGTNTWGIHLLRLFNWFNASNSHRSECLNKACEICERAKQTKENFPLSTYRASSNFDLIHCDIWGPYKTLSSCGASCFVTLVDDHSWAVWIYLLCEKREVSQTIMNFFALVEWQYNKCIKVVRSDNGTKFTCLK